VKNRFFYSVLYWAFSFRRLARSQYSEIRQLINRFLKVSYVYLKIEEKMTWVFLQRDCSSNSFFKKLIPVENGGKIYGKGVGR
jgi:hypothetical protein